MSEYTPPAGNEVSLPLEVEHEQPAGNQVALPIPDDLEPPPPPPPLEPGLVTSLVWRDGARKGLEVKCSHGLAAGLEIERSADYADGDPAAGELRAPWRFLNPLESHRATGWRDTDPLEQSTDAAWRSLLPVEIARGLLYRDTDPRSVEAEARWLLADTIGIDRGTRHGLGRPLEIECAGPWILGTMVYPDWEVPWGWGKPPRTLVDNPNIDHPVPPTPQPPPVYVPPAGNQVDLPFTCKRFDVPGNQVGLPFRKYQCLRSSLVVENDVILKRVSDDTQVACIQISINGDLESYTNAWSAQVAVEDFTLVDPTDTGPVEVVATINGQDHLLLLERFGRDEVFDPQGGKTATVRVQGRSISAELDEPYSARKSRFETQAKSHWQLMQQELPGNWTLEAHPAWSDYGDNITALVPANTFSYTDLSPIQAVARIAEATGAVVQQVPESRTLRIVPRRIGKAWEWDQTTADLEVDAGQIRSSAVECEPAVRHNGVFVRGETNGVEVQCERDGTGGDPWLDMVVDQLITDAQHGLQRGISELGATGKRQVYTVELPIDKNDDGLINTGQIINVVESVTDDWNGQPIAWSLSANRSAQDGLVIWQRIAVERYRDE